MSPPPTHRFDPARFLTPKPLAGGAPALVILNQPVPRLDVFERLWTHAAYRLCADGGANRLFDMCDDPSNTKSNGHHEEDAAAAGCRERFLPSVIHGDLDSLRDDVRDWYASRGVPISRDLDQYSTDFGKAIKKVTVEHCNRTAGAGQTKNGCTESRDGAAGQEHTANGVEQDGSGDAGTDILILCTLAGRVDQGLGLLYEMLRTHNQHNALRLWLFSESSVSFILPPGENRIAVRAGFFTENVGILPAFGPATISTSGLEWDVSDWYTCVTGNVSTSNHVKAEEVVVRTDASVLFTIEREERLP
ncbi:uncharacterized protein K452DRAFT_287821 [Aplosporella prunicola CBS 121167]|uniref:Thiamine pyrophosphokinase n=1 Tax=Aplosporella prunicola CBS 121167 TaxID=1176127 RepID=A0A6A6BCI7_9PEZI|nr:uncharacterized protein K452DRAFT_287821 [Aplosporella prunicola CBS 121167]KAF2141850.1 hypothetical protein K452DRAFT_287821 [Aplosporella prunicola CBS 121167]